MLHCGASRRKRATSFQAAASTTTVSSPYSECVSSTAAPKFFLMRSIKAFDMIRGSLRSGDRGARFSKLHQADVLFDDRVLTGLDHRWRAVAGLDLVLQQHQTVEHCFR